MILSKVTLVKTGTTEKLVLSPRRNGTLTFQVKPTHGTAHAVAHRSLVACHNTSITLPSGHGVVQIGAASGKRHETETARY